MQHKKRWLVHLLIVVFVVSVISVIYQKTQAISEWQNVGQAGFSDGYIYEASIAVHECKNINEQPIKPQTPGSELLGQVGLLSYSGGGTNTKESKCIEIYTGFKDIANNGYMSVMKYNQQDDKWEYVGKPGFSNNGVTHTDLALNSKGVPYVVFAYGKLFVMKFNGVDWEYVGNPNGITSGLGVDTSLKFDHNDIPYLSSSSVISGNKRASVLRFNGTSWEDVDNPNGVSPDRADETALYFDSKNVPYVAFTDMRPKGTYGVTVMKHNDTKKSWDYVGKYNFPKSSSEFLSLKIDLNDKPVVSFIEDNKKLVVMEFDGANWNYVGDPVTLGAINHPPSLIIGNDNSLYIFFQDSTNSNKATVKKYNKSTNTWVDIKKAGFSTAGVRIYDNKSIVIDSEGDLYVAFKDYGNKDKVTVMTTADNLKSHNKASWQNVGTAGFTSGVANFISLNVDSQNNKYVTFQDYAKGAKASAMKFDGINWSYIDGVGGFSNGVAAFISSAIDFNNNIYVAYQDGSLKGRVTVKKFDGLNWTNVGAPGFSTGSVSNTNIKLDINGTPYLAYIQGSKVFVMKFDNTNWVDVSSSSLPQSTNVALSIDPNGIPHVALKDNSKSGKLTVMEYDPIKNIWNLVGPTSGFSKGKADNISLTFSSNNIPTVLFNDGSLGGKATVMYFDGKNWINFGKPGFSAGRVGFTSIDIDTRDKWNNVTYVSYVDYDNGKKIYVMKDDPIKGWISVGSTIGPGLYSSLKLDSNGVPFNVFQDASKGNKATLMKYE